MKISIIFIFLKSLLPLEHCFCFCFLIKSHRIGTVRVWENLHLTTELWCCLRCFIDTQKSGSDSSPFSQKFDCRSSSTCFPSHGWPVNKCVFSLVNDGRSLSIKLHYTNETEASNLEIDKKIHLMMHCFSFSWAFLLNVRTHNRIIQLDWNISKWELS